MQSNLPLSTLLVCVSLAACGGSDFTSESAPAGDAGADDAAAGTGGTAGGSGAAGAGGSGGASGTGGVAGADAGTCDADQTCFENVPAGWTPVAVADTNTVGCVAPVHPLFSIADIEQAAAFECPCSCGPAASDSCSAQLDFFSDATCTASLPGICSVAAGCTQCTNAPTNASYMRFSVTPTAACTQPPTPTAPAVSDSGFECNALATSTPTACGDGGLCISQFAPAARICLLRAGDVNCPAGYDKSRFFEALDDTRGCAGSCSCTGVCTCFGTECQLNMHSDMNCSGSGPTLTAGDCSHKAEGTFGAEFSASMMAAPEIGCQRTGGFNPTGGLTGKNPVTICCAP